MTVAERAAEIFSVLGIATNSIAASGRYQRSDDIWPGVTYWSTSFDRERTDALGVQFSGVGLSALMSVRDRFLRAGFVERNPGTARVTLCKAVARDPTGGLNREGLQKLKREVDALLDQERNRESTRKEPGRFAAFMKASPLADVELDLGTRAIEERPDSL